jgi:hypothetical protein
VRRKPKVTGEEAERSVMVFIRLPVPIAERIRQMAKADERSVNVFLRRIVLKALEAEAKAESKG